MKISYLFLFVFFLLSIQEVVGQSETATYTINGVIADSASNQPLDFITVNLMKDPGGVVKVDYSKTDGTFSLKGLQRGSYTVVVVGVGYKARKINLTLADSLKTAIDLGVLVLSPDVLGLKEVVVSAAKPIVSQEVDRLTYDLQADPESKVNNVLEMMRKVPLLALDGDNNLLLKGSPDFKIFINGKPSSIMERSYKDILRSMPASSIQRIEVITSPPAKYDAEGLAGIINIITNKKIDNGYNGSLNISERFPTGGPGLGGSISAKMGKFGISAFGGANRYTNPQTRNRTERSTFGDASSLLDLSGTSRNKNDNGYLGVEMSYELDSLNLISAQLNLNGGKVAGFQTQVSSLTGDSGVEQGFRLNAKNDGTGGGRDVALNYQKGFKADKNRLLTFSYRLLSFDSQENADLAISDRINYDEPDYRQNNDQRFFEQTFQVDYVHPWKKMTVEAGVKGIFRKNSSDFQYLITNEEGGFYTGDDLMGNAFRNTQNVYAAYTTYHYNFKKWNVKAGARIEQTVIDADFMSTESKIRRNYFNVIPSVSVGTKLKNDRALNFAYTQRIQRPGIYQLNPFVDRSNPNFERTGNPELRPALVNDMQLSYNSSKKVSVNVALGFAFFKDLIFQVAVFDPESQITRTSYGNTGTAKLPSMNVNLNYPLTKKWTMSFNGRVAYGIVQGEVNGKLIKNRGLMYFNSLSTTYKLEKDWRVSASVNANGPNLQFQGTSNSIVSSSFSISKDLIHEKLSFSAAVNNPFSKYRTFRNETFGPDFLQNSYRYDYFRSFNVSLNYKFGKLKEAIKKNKRGIRNDDVQGGN